MRRKASGAADGEARWGRLTTARRGRFSRWNGPPSVSCLSFLFFLASVLFSFGTSAASRAYPMYVCRFCFFLLWRRRGGGICSLPSSPSPSLLSFLSRPRRSPAHPLTEDTTHVHGANGSGAHRWSLRSLSLRRPWRSSACERSPHPFPRIVPLWDAAKPPGRRSDENGKGMRERRWDALPLIETTHARTCLSVNLRVGAHKPRRCPAQADRQQERTWSGMCVALSNVCLWLRVSLSGRCCGLRVRWSLSCFG